MTVLIDTSVWADHFRAADPTLATLIAADRVTIHPFVIGELAMGNLRERRTVIAMLASLPALPVVDEDTWLAFVEREALGGSGLGFVDAHLLAAVTATGSMIWTRDRRLGDRAEALGCRWAG